MYYIRSEKRITKSQEITFVGDGYIYFHNGSDGLIGIYINIKTYQTVHFMCSFLFVNYTTINSLLKI